MNSSGESIKYSTSLLERFQNLYAKKFDKRISEQKAMRELKFLASIVKILLVKRIVESTNRKGGKK